ncbi:transposase [Paenibacillus sp. J5C_2022]|uniref:transposase n=1 Tax=Paenibacillus sp. J5C2022 TaxID=2977129 RepID=UPI0021CFFC9B|nr:transposase [Paenibacillus sp. J5C2022]MCU6713267.1 transposase [Paenibacillus sp. J5C2022]
MSEKRQHYSEEFKEQAVRYIQEQTKSVTQIAQELNVPEGTIRQWQMRYRKFENEPLVDRETLRQKDRQLKEQALTIEDLQEEIAILKKAMHIFSKERN